MNIAELAQSLLRADVAMVRAGVTEDQRLAALTDFGRQLVDHELASAAPPRGASGEAQP